MHKKDNVRIYMKEPMKLGFLNDQKLKMCRKISRIKGLSEEYRPYRHKSRTLSLSHRVGGNRKRQYYRRT